MDRITLPTTDLVQDLDKIDAHLSELHRRATGVEGVGTFVPVARSLLLNFVVFVSGSEQMTEAGGVVGEIMGSHPCRVIIVDLGEAGPDGATASISAVCGITERGDRRLCGEIVELYVENPGEDLVGLVMPVLVPDVPVIIRMIEGVPCGSDMFKDIISVTDQVLTDSRAFGDLRTELPGLLEACRADGYQRSVQDLAWLSLLTWRELTAQHFDPPQTREYLANLSRIVVRYAFDGHGGLPSAPLLFASWLIERAGMEVVGARRHGNMSCLIGARQGEHDVSVELVAEENSQTPGRLLSVSIQANGDPRGASFYLQSVSGSEVSVTEECVGICYPPLVVELPDEREAALVARALDNRARDMVYEDAVGVACKVLSMLESSV